MGQTKEKILNPDATMSLGDHLEELRLRLILALLGLGAGLVIGLIFGAHIISFIEIPFVQAMTSQGYEARLQTLAPADGFISYVKIALIAGFIISSPWVFYQIWMFVAAGLYKHERRFVYLAAPFSAVLFITGALFFMFIVAPVTLTFLIQFNEDVLNVRSQFTFAYYISFITLLTLVFGIAFQTPIAIYFLHRTGIVSTRALKKSRRYVILTTVIVAAIATPSPDPISQITLAVPLYLLFELGLLLGTIADHRQKKRNPSSPHQ